MKKRIFPICLAIAALILVLVLSACSSTGNTNKQTNQGAQAYQRANLMGQVTAITGNQVSIKVIELPQMPSGSAGQRPTGDQQKPATTQGSTQPTASPAPASSPNNASTQKQRNYSFTGEEKSIVIPVGVTITSNQRTVSASANPQGNSNVSVQTVTLDFKDIQVGDIISIWYSEKDNTAIARISISSSTSTSGQDGGFPGGDFPGGERGGEPPAGGPGGN